MECKEKYIEDGLFYKHKDKNCFIEGYIGNKDKFNGVLFLLREPNSGDDDAGVFWVKAFVSKNTNEEKFVGSEQRYFNAMNNILKVLPKEANVENCCYINLYPFNGKSEVNSNYNNTKKALVPNNRKSYKEIPQEYKDIAENRIKVMEELKNLNTVITTKDIFEKLSRRFKKSKEIVTGFHLKDKEFHKFTYNINNKHSITFYSIYHPSRNSSEYTL